MVAMDAVEMFHPHLQDWGDPSNTTKQDSPDLSTPELNGGNGIEINWDKFKVSYDCPRCLKRMLKKPYHQGLMWANHFTPIFDHTSTHLNTTEDDDGPLEHISTCAFFHFQSPVSHFDFEYLDAIEKKDLLKDFAKPSSMYCWLWMYVTFTSGHHTFSFHLSSFLIAACV